MLLNGLLSRALRLLCVPVFLFLAASQMHAQSTTVVISQVYGAGGNSGATFNADFVELFNLSNAPVDISNWSVQYGSAASPSGTTTTTTGLFVIPAGITLAPGEYYLLAADAGTTGAAVTADQTYPTSSFALSGTDGKVFLVNNSTKLDISNAGCPAVAVAATVIDFVGFGSSSAKPNCYEGIGATGAGPAPLGGSTTSTARINRCVDTNVNSADFATITPPVPHNSSTTLAPCGAVAPTGPTLTAAQAMPATVMQGGSTMLSVTATAGTNPIASVTVDLSAFGGSPTQALAGSGSGTYTYTLTVPGGQAVAGYTLTFTASDNASTPLTNTTTTMLAITAAVGSTNPTLTSPSATPSTVTSGQTTIVGVKPVAGTNPTSMSYTVTADLSAIGGPASQPLNDTGANGDTAGDGVYSFQYTVPAGFTPGTYNVTFNAIDNNLHSAVPVTTPVTVQAPIPPSLTLAITSSASQAVVGASVTFTVTSTVNMGVPSGGTLTISDASGTLGTATATTPGTWAFTTTTLSLGTHVVIATYSGDNVYPSYTIPVDSAATVTISPVPVADFSFTLSNQAIILNSQLKMGSTMLGVGMVNGFSAPVTFSCSGLPAGSRCAFSPATLSTSGSSTMTIAIDGAALHPHDSPFGRDKSIVALGLLALPLLLRRKLRKKLGVAGTMLGALLLGAALLSVNGCSSGTTTSTGTSSLTVTATGGGVTHNATISLIVQ